MHRLDFHRLIPSRISSEVRSEDYFELVGLMVEGVGARELPSVIDDHIFLACSWRVQEGYLGSEKMRMLSIGL